MNDANQQKSLHHWVSCHNLAAIARKLKCNKRTVNRWVHGQSVPPADKLFALAQIIRVDPRCIAIGSPSDAEAEEENAA